MPIFGGRAVGAFAPGTISFDWTPEPEVVAAELMVTAGRIEDRSQPLLLSERVAIADMRERFETETDPDGNAWVPWAASYMPKAMSTNMGGILHRFGALQAGATDPGAYSITNDSLFFSTAGMPEYWIYHQTGADRNVDSDSAGFAETIRGQNFRQGGTGERLDLRKTGVNLLPARPFVGPSFEAQLQMMEIFDQWFGGIVNETFSRGSKVVAVKRGAGGRFTSQQQVF